MIMLRNVARNRQLALYCNGVMQYYANLLAKSQAWPAVVAGTGVAKWRGSGGIQRERERKIDKNYECRDARRPRPGPCWRLGAPGVWPGPGRGGAQRCQIGWRATGRRPGGAGEPRQFGRIVGLQRCGLRARSQEPGAWCPRPRGDKFFRANRARRGPPPHWEPAAPERSATRGVRRQRPACWLFSAPLACPDSGGGRPGRAARRRCPSRRAGGRAETGAKRARVQLVGAGHGRSRVRARPSLTGRPAGEPIISGARTCRQTLEVVGPGAGGAPSAGRAASWSQRARRRGATVVARGHGNRARSVPVGPAAP